VATEGVVTNAERLVTLRVAGVVQQPSLHASVDPEGSVQSLPGMGGVLIRPNLGDPANGWMSDHLEIGASLVHPDPAADEALQSLSCVGNAATIVDGPASGATGIIVGKHGSTMVAFAPDVLARLAPGERVVIDAVGVGLRVEGETHVVLHSCSPWALGFMVPGRDGSGRLRVRVVTTLPAEAAGAGIGMPADRYNIDLQVDHLPASSGARRLRFGDLVALEDQDHRFVRRPRQGWTAVGAICHGRSVGGGHGLGMITLLTAPTERLALKVTQGANIVALVESRERDDSAS